MAELVSENTLLTNTLEQTHQSNAALHDSLRISEDRERTLTAGLTALRDDRESVGRSLAEACANLDLRQFELARLSEDREALQHRYDATVDERDRLNASVAALEHTQQGLEQELRSRMAVLETLEADLDSSRQRYANLEQLLAMERAEYTASLTQAREEQQSLLRAIDEEQAAAQQLQAVIRDHESAALAAERRINQAETAISALTVQARETQAHFSEELRQARARHEEIETVLQQREHELAQRAALAKQREGELESANRSLSRLEQNLAAQKDQFESVRTGLECDIDAANNRVRATEAALQGTRAENSALANVLKEKEELIGREQRSRQQLESAKLAVSQDLDTARKRVSITDAENESLTTQLENATLREKETARDLSLAQATIRSLQETIQQKENAVQQEKIRTAQLLHQTVSALQSELTQINTADAQRGPSSKWMSALNLDGRVLADDVQRELPFSSDEGASGNGNANGNGTHYGAGHASK
jgi:chromosome segregation ATPase